MAVAIWFVVSATVLTLVGAVTALGEEIGWRGFLVPELAQRQEFHQAALVSGLIWAYGTCP